VYEKYTSIRCQVSEGRSGMSLLTPPGVPFDTSAWCVEGVKIVSKPSPTKILLP